ncbi:MAG: hypothetical protein HY270_15710 [Deltaproteobacteria bacterium]|nr:hypothetical protein [Deltaproteobacteria bacterium]
MRLGVKPVAFLVRLLAWFAVTYALWMQLAPLYTQFLAVLSQPAVSLFDRPTLLWAQSTSILFWPRTMTPPSRPPAVAAEWIQANLVLLIPLMLATPAATWAMKAKRCALALAIVVAWQILDVTLAIKFGYATQIDPRAYPEWKRYFYAFATNLVMFLDTQVIPFMIWAGIHFRQLLGTLGASPVAAKIAGRSSESVAGRSARKLGKVKA